MPLFVPLLRLFMLFLNIYDSYKTLRHPLPSARHEGRPSQRALTQRKRNMKGCLAVWIVWSCVMAYENFAEGLVSLFVPFYDEVKCMAFVFLIMTRARGAEPIFLHVIRPLVKPYSQTIDMSLDIGRMVGDILFVILSIPTNFIYAWYKTSIFYTEEVLDSETESSPETSITPVEIAVAAAIVNGPVGKEQRGVQSIRFPKKVNPRPHSRETSNGGDNIPSSSHTRLDRVGQNQNALTNHKPNAHRIWYPPPSSYSDEEENSTTVSGLPPAEMNPGILSNEAVGAHEAVDEWRQYPPFPSAYPPTPLIITSAALPSTSAGAARTRPIPHSRMLSEILEDSPQQDFRQSLLPPRKPLNPGFVDGLSDEIHASGVPSRDLETMSVDSDSEDTDEEDVFNTTLQTPMPPLRATRSGIVPILPINREVSVASSIASRSTTLTSAGYLSPLRTQSSSESLSSGALSMSDLSSVLGKKRPLPLDTMDVNRGLQMTISNRNSWNAAGAASSRRGGINTTFRSARVRLPNQAVREDTESRMSSAGDDDSIDERKPAFPKRRKVNSPPRHTITSTRNLRPRIARYATVPTRAQIPKLTNAPSSSSLATTHRSTRTNPTEGAVTGDASQTSTSSLNDVNSGTRPKTKAVTKGKSRQAAPKTNT